MLKDGDLAPDLDLASADGSRLRLSEIRGHPVVVFFYPKDDTSGCTREAKDFSALRGAFEEAGAKIVGISPDSVASHERFRAKHDLTVALASDTERTAANAYGVWAEKAMYGRKYMGVERSTFLIDASGRITRSWRKVNVEGHAEEVLAAVRELARSFGTGAATS